MPVGADALGGPAGKIVGGGLPDAPAGKQQIV